MNNINYVGMYDIGDEEFTLGKEKTVEVPETGDCSTIVDDFNFLSWNLLPCSQETR